MCRKGLGVDQKPGGNGITVKIQQTLCQVPQLKDTRVWKGNFTMCVSVEGTAHMNVPHPLGDRTALCTQSYLVGWLQEPELRPPACKRSFEAFVSYLGLEVSKMPGEREQCPRISVCPSTCMGPPHGSFLLNSFPLFPPVSPVSTVTSMGWPVTRGTLG